MSHVHVHKVISVLMEHQSLTNSLVHLELIITEQDAQELRTVSVAGLACIAQLKVSWSKHKVLS